MKINFVGDIGIFRKYEELGIDPAGSVWLPEADLNVGNFEFVVTEKGRKFFYDVQDGYSCSPDYLSKIRIERFRYLGMANNHSMDYGPGGAIDTIASLKKKGIDVFGFSDHYGFTPGKAEANGIKTGFLGCVKDGRWSRQSNGTGPDPYDAGLIIEWIRKYRDEFDHLIIFPHWGTELVDIPNPQDIKNARLFIDEGASAVIGHHPHVPQGIEKYRNGIIAYSLGSFIYIHEDELGYSEGNENRLISICLNLEFSKETVTGFRAYYYRYNKSSKLPEPVPDIEIDNYKRYLDNNIENYGLYKSGLRNILIRRELLSFKKRLLKKPLKTILHYARYLFTRTADKIFKK